MYAELVSFVFEIYKTCFFGFLSDEQIIDFVHWLKTIAEVCENRLYEYQPKVHIPPVGCAIYKSSWGTSLVEA